MLGRRNREFPSHHPEGFAARANDLESLRAAVVDAASVGAGLWLSYLFALFYFAIAAGAVTHRDLFLESPVKLPFLNVELPLKAFFVLGPLVFIVVHAYVLLHFVMLAGKVGAFHGALEDQIKDGETRARLRRQLPSNIFVQFLGGPRDVRTGIIGLLLKSVAWISLIAAPIAAARSVPAAVPAVSQLADYLVAAVRGPARPDPALAAVAADCSQRNHAAALDRTAAAQGGDLGSRQRRSAAPGVHRRDLPRRMARDSFAGCTVCADPMAGMEAARRRRHSWLLTRRPDARQNPKTSQRRHFPN